MGRRRRRHGPHRLPLDSAGGQSPVTLLELSSEKAFADEGCYRLLLSNNRSCSPRKEFSTWSPSSRTSLSRSSSESGNRVKADWTERCVPARRRCPGCVTNTDSFAFCVSDRGWIRWRSNVEQEESTSLCSRSGTRAPKTKAAFVLQDCGRTTVIALESEASSCARLVTFLDFDTLERERVSYQETAPSISRRGVAEPRGREDCP